MKRIKGFSLEFSQGTYDFLCIKKSQEQIEEHCWQKYFLFVVMLKKKLIKEFNVHL